MNRNSPLLILCFLYLGAVGSALVLNNTLDGANTLKTACRKTEVWTTPQWSASVRWNCRQVIGKLERLVPESLISDQTFGHEFLPRGQIPEYPATEAVRTPWKLTSGTNFSFFYYLFFPPHSSHGSSSVLPHSRFTKGVGRIGPCTMAVTTLDQVPLGYMPLEVGPRPFPISGYTSWWLVRQSLLELITECVDRGEGGIAWFGKLGRSFPGFMRVFGY